MLSTDKAYLFGLIIGGGSFGESNNRFIIKLPYRSWGDIDANPGRASEIARDILLMVKPIFNTCYSIDCSFDCSSSWKIECFGDLSELKSDLEQYKISPSYEMRKTSDISCLVSKLNSATLKRRFIAGLADSIGSTAPSHRRFNEDTQIISFEFSGFNYPLVFELCKMFATLGTFADQILWNHPNMHSSSDPYYTNWKKGTKLRLTLDDYTSEFSFAFKSKRKSANENRSLEHKVNSSVKCSERDVGRATLSCFHPAESSSDLPKGIRGGHFFHNRHYCCALGCPYAPYEEIDYLFESRRGELICPFPVLHKGSYSDVLKCISSSPFLSRRTYQSDSVRLKELVSSYMSGDKKLYFSRGESGYPIERIMDAANYLIQAKEGMLHGNRTTGARDIFLQTYLSENLNCEFVVLVPDLVSALVIYDEKKQYAAIVGAKNPSVYSKLITRDPENKYKFVVREISEEDY